MIKIDIFSGFLGAGKTTLIKKLLNSNIKNEKVVLIENEFGQIGIDGSFLRESCIEIKEINSGCICCSLVGDFEKSIKEIIKKFNPERIIIEPSGVGKLSDIIDAVKKIKDEDLVINILCTIVDGPKAKMHLNNFGEFFNNQIESASSIIVSKTDKINEDKLQETVNIIKDINESANIITTNIEELDSNDLLKFLEEKTSLNHLLDEIEEEHHHHDEYCCCHDEEEHHHHDEHCCCHDEEEHHHHDEHCCCHDEEEHHHHDEHCCCHDEEEHHHHDEHCCCHDEEHHHHHADEVFSSWGLETVKSISKDNLEEFLNELSSNKYGIILRSKGILKASDNSDWYYFDYVSGDYSIRLGRPDYTGRIVVIGSKIDEKSIENLFNKKA